MQKGNRTVLLVEDEAIIALVEKSTLERHGYRVLIAHDGESAIAAVAQSPEIDLILMDIDLGKGSDGTVVAEAILQDRDLPVVFLSSHTEPEVVERTEGITSYGYIVKNSGETVLLASIRMAFRLFEAKLDARLNAERLRDTAEYLAEAQTIAQLGRWDYYHEEERLALGDKTFDMLGVDPDGCNGSVEALFDRVHPADADRVRAAWDRSIRDLEPYSIEYRVLAPEGPVRWLVTKVWVVRETPDEQLHSVGVVQDVTDRKRTELELREVDDRFRVLFDNAPLGYQSLDDNGRFLEVNQAWLEMFGYSRDEVIGKWFGDFLDPTSAEAFRERFPLFKKRGEIQSEFFMTSSSGRKIFVNIAGRIGTNPDGSFKQTHCILKNETDRRNAELALVQSESLHREIISGTDDVVAIIGGDGTNRYKSDNVERIFGWRPEELIGASAFDKVHPDDRASAREAFKRLISCPEERIQLECRYMCKDGTYRWIEFAGSNRIDDSRFNGVLGSYRDITARKKADQALRTSLVELQKSQRVANVGSWIWHVQTGRLEWSDQMYRIFGIVKESFTGDLSDVIARAIHPDDRERVEQSNQSVATQRTPIPVEYRVIRPDGEIRVVWAEAGELELDANGEPALLRGIVHDITDRKRIEEALRNSEAILSKSEELSRSGGWEWDLASDLFTVSAGWQRVHGYSGGAVSRSDLMPIAHPDDRSRVEEALQRCLDGDARYDLEHRIIRQDDGETRTVHAIGEVMRDGAGNPVKMHGAVVDISRRAEEQDRIARLVQEKDTLLQETHHRVKNGFMAAESLLGVHAAAVHHPDAAAALRDAQSRIASMTLLYDALLQADEYQEVDAKEYLDEVARSAVAAHDSAVPVRLSMEIVSVKLTPKRASTLGAIVAELVTNSMKYGARSSAAAGNATITVTLEHAADELVLLVEDNGPGMPPGFDPGRSGSFGVALVKMLADQMGGTVGRDTPGGSGLRTTVRIPGCRLEPVPSSEDAVSSTTTGSD